MGRNIHDMKENTDILSLKEQLYFKIDFYYYPVGRGKEKTKNPTQPYYFDFNQDFLISDV
jgi:hypothetical protein